MTSGLLHCAIQCVVLGCYVRASELCDGEGCAGEGDGVSILQSRSSFATTSLSLTHTVPTMHQFEAPIGSRCQGKPPGSWGDLLESGSEEECKQACVAKESCQFAVYKFDFESCTEYNDCDTLLETDGHTWSIWQKATQEAEAIADMTEAEEVDAMTANENVGFSMDTETRLKGTLVPDVGDATLGDDILMPRVIDCGGPEYCELTLTARIIRPKPGGTATYTRGFDGGLPEFPLGPTLRVNPGETLKVILHNQLGEYNPSPHDIASMRNETFDEWKHFIGYLNSTNFHTHGLHVSGSKFENRTEDFIFASIHPQQSRQYDIMLPPDHMGGLAWYHAHHHHSTAMQAGGGSAGLILVVDPPGYFEHAGIPQITEMRTFLLVLNLIDGLYLNTIGAEGDDQIMTLPTDGATLYVNGQILPTLTVQPGEWIRMRMCFSAVERSVRAEPKSDDGAVCELQLLAKDGVYLHEIPREITSISFFPGARSDVAVRCNCPAGVSECTAVFFSNVNHKRKIKVAHGMEHYGGAFDGDIIKIKIQGAQTDSTALPVVQVARPCYLVDLQGVTVEDDNKHEINLHGARLSPPYRAVRWKQTPTSAKSAWTSTPWYEPMEQNDTILQRDAIGTMTLGVVQEILFTGFQYHPLHVHVNPYQIQGWADSLNDPYFKPGDWHDVIMDPIGRGEIRFQTDRFAKQVVFHCHFIRHEDSGMMSWLWIPEPTEGQPISWAGAKDVDENCYSGAFPYAPST